MDATEIRKILDDHKKWINGDGGSRANLSGANLSGADLSDADPRGADLIYANLRGADLRGADLRGADLPVKIVVPDLDQKMFAACEAPDALEMSTWHSCETTHCRAGWAVKLAGEAGRVAEDLFGPAVAGSLIYAATYPDRKIPDFYANNETAMDDIRKCAASTLPPVAG